MSVIGIGQVYRTGYTLIELMVVVVILALLVTTVAWVDSAVIATTKGARDSERSSDTQALATVFEQYYNNNPIGSSGSTYPTVTQISNSASSIIADNSIMTPPGDSAPALETASDNTVQSPDVDHYIYQPLDSSGGLCYSAPCVRFKLYYHTERTDQTVVIESRHQQ